jgi:hypothetical protein
MLTAGALEVAPALRPRPAPVKLYMCIFMPPVLGCMMFLYAWQLVVEKIGFEHMRCCTVSFRQACVISVSLPC